MSSTVRDCILATPYELCSHTSTSVYDFIVTSSIIIIIISRSQVYSVVQVLKIFVNGTDLAAFQISTTSSIM